MNRILLIAVFFLGCTQVKHKDCPCEPAKTGHPVCIICTDNNNCTPCEDCEYVDGECVSKK